MQIHVGTDAKHAWGMTSRRIGLELTVHSDVFEYRYDVMLECWSLDPIERPSFSHLVQSLSQILEGVSGYIDVGAFGTASLCSTMTESEANIIQETSRDELTPEES